ncbi:hypothetical protein [Mastigocoleus sp. MO_188.B34]|uniref:hypothetical protein n=1 Tax=Mastigocoleus sp. MO_188.B34 TaxID=3036635 RepID=UPI002629319C|nr:hypothetical protein [Mastigocoleus sp. MO_188.B34]MDJ0695677.1 hypothetical protein [Mastigocoleus sp. MO_188.B34]
MTKHTQAQLTRTVDINQPTALKQRTFNQMEYYMGAKLIEIGVDPKSAVYRWSVERKNNQQIWTIKAYWGESKENLSNQPLTGTNLIDCARANAEHGIKMTADLCGYGEDISSFQQALKLAGNKMGLEIETLSDLIAYSQNLRVRDGIDVAPDTSSSL